ncbi:sensor histidine kinase [Flavobacterium sp.]|uniref:tetratricopeptide repeat-containing sensor histidine kinase n=1 Tax=Flavobacterium sp. TaxID=239 RepID=UPI00286E5C4C|nr:sensor histidine kinase [Flavobacterium sp.]
MRKIIMVVFLLVTLVSFSQTQQENIQKLKTLNNDTIKAKILGNIAYDYGIKNPDSAFYFFNESKKLSAKLKHYSGQIRCNVNIGELYRQMGNYEESLRYDLMNIKLAERHGTQVQKANCYANMSTTYHYLIKFDSCAKYDLKAQRIYESLEDKTELVTFYSNLAESYTERHLYKKALEYGFKALNLSKKGFGTQLDLAYVLSSISTTYIYLNQNQNALKYAEKALLLSKNEKEYYLQQVILGNTILIKTKQKKYSDLFLLVDELEILKKDINSIEYDANILVHKGLVYFYNNQLQKSKEFILQALKISELNNLSVISKNSYGLLNKIEASLGNYYESDIYEAKKDSIYELQVNEGTIKNIQELEKKYETQKKQTEIIKLKAKNEKKSNLNKILIASSIALLLVGFLGYRNFRNKQKLQTLKITELEKDKQLLAVDAMLKGQEEERGRIAKDLHDGLGGLLSGTKLSFTNMKENLLLTPENALQFEKSLGMLDTTIADLRKVAHNLMPEALVKFGLNDALRDFCNSIQQSTNITVDYQKLGIDRKIDNTAETFIYRIIQELVNNAVKHANAKEIMVQLTIENNKVLLTVEDDGKGYNQNQSTKGDGLGNIAYRVHYLKGKIDTATSPNNGTTVNIELNA